jgi:YlmC/YmxH family sporulation protein
LVKITEFQVKDVVNVSDGKRLGNISDFDINLQNGKIERIILTGNGKGLRFLGKDKELIIPWANIVKIGKDVVLVRLPPFDTNNE